MFEIILPHLPDRVGGRTLTRQLTAADGTKDFFDIGGEWVGRPQPHMHYLLQKFGIHTFNPVVPPSEGGGDAMRTITLSWQTQLDLYQLIWKVVNVCNVVCLQYGFCTVLYVTLEKTKS
ncbi:amine oxidase [Plakobranchus ocellatus]|uniref:Amine oxidase n=1 Tax=Plakobranchus ocellatus TaxID=259542 RepID=A0AAV4DNM8_9GAST|nr:amine oxidase [Plakobranchus ocellatus]